MNDSAQARRRFRPLSLTDSKHDLPSAPNRLRGVAAPGQRDTVWVADITHVKTNAGFLYVAGVLGRCTRRGVGWAMGYSLATCCHWRYWTWPCNNGGPPPVWCIIRIAASNTPVKPIGKSWLPPASSPSMSCRSNG